MSSDVEFQEEDESLDPILTRDMQKLAQPILPSMLMKFGVVANLKQANRVLAGVTIVFMITTCALIAQAFVGDDGGLDEYPAIDVSKGV